MWWHRAVPEAAGAVPSPLRHHRRVPLTVGAFVRYADTPVGPYHEVLAIPAALLTPLPNGTVPFIAVDSEPSVAGGRDNWALPKTLARFEWPGDRLEVAAHDDGWDIGARMRASGPRVPFAAPVANRQAGPDGREWVMGIAGRGWARLGRAAVEVAGPGAPPWLRAGTHLALHVTGARVRFAAPRKV